ncbi:hypothetical protein ACGFWD_42300 [Streptomyces sp. NPDC048448]|uniref:hypothetical protein n=1 Tax=unclassified Streptomyces TaxID=2593676 RepID=UPI00143E188D|nr:hypothetical protein [Streptomyces sp. RPA4-2]QIY60397.1 hypothetical protein HEP85_40485 [Streptomyces sp. RPA4-2]
MAAGPTPSSSSNSTIIETDSTPNDLIKPEVVNQQVRKTADGSAGPGPAPAAQRTVVRRSERRGRS